VSLVLETVVDSLQDLLGQLVKAMPALMSAVMVLLLTRYTVESVSLIQFVLFTIATKKKIDILPPLNARYLAL
jgi:hypothetical protein